MTLRGVAAIVGVGELKPERRTEPGKGPLELIGDVSRLAMQDAGVTIRDIDGLLVDPINEGGMLLPGSTWVAT